MCQNNQAMGRGRSKLLLTLVSKSIVGPATAPSRGNGMYSSGLYSSPIRLEQASLRQLRHIKVPGFNDAAILAPASLTSR